MLDYKIKNANIVDGSGKPAYRGTVGIRNGKLTFQTEEAAAEEIDAEGLFLCPGFIDSHSHSDRYMGTDPQIVSLCKISQGITTEVTGQCGSALFPVPPARRE